jgi:hypothetical protein
MLEKQARDLARELNDSYLDAYRSKTIKPTKVLDDETSPIKELGPLRTDKELPFKKYQANKYDYRFEKGKIKL